MKGEWIGFIAAFLTTVSFVPQMLRVIKTRHTKSISLPMYIAFTIGVLFWLVYGIINNSPPIIASNSITAVLSGIILVMKIKNG